MVRGTALLVGSHFGEGLLLPHCLLSADRQRATTTNRVQCHFLHIMRVSVRETTTHQSKPITGPGVNIVSPIVGTLQLSNGRS